ncbi:MAG: hypothetical protein Q4A37_01615 [Candidatus Saccharibacteria bacterium]|nr:hypothetical protein [Candidatus Saccharibacteria bacterium]
MYPARFKQFVFENGSLTEEDRDSAQKAAAALADGLESASFSLPSSYTEAIEGKERKREVAAQLTFTAAKLLSIDDPSSKHGGAVLAGEVFWRKGSMLAESRRGIIAISYEPDDDGTTPDAIIDTDHFGAMQYYHSQINTTPKSAL